MEFENFQIPNLSKHQVKDFRAAMDFLVLGCRQRSKADTAMNAQSSRSHAVFTITLNKIGDVNE